MPDPPDALILTIVNNGKGIDKLKKINILIASNNTWQGIIINGWPYSKAPTLLEQKFIPNVYKMAYVHLEENLWKNRNGYTNFNKCIMDKDDGNCLSIFDIKTNEMENR